MEAIPLPNTVSGSLLAIVILGAIAQLLLLGLWHRVRPWSIVVIRTIIIQVFVVLAVNVLAQRWPFSFPAKYTGIDLPPLMGEGFLVLWYLIQPRSRSKLEVDGEEY